MVHAEQVIVGAARGCLLAAMLLAAAPLPAHEDAAREPRVAAEATTPEEQAINDLLIRYATAFAAKDLSALRSLLASDQQFSMFEGSHRDFGWESYRDHVAPELEVMQNLEYHISDIRAFAEGSLGYATFTWTMDVVVVSDEFEDGRHPVSMRGVGTAIVSREATGWRIRHLATARE